MRKATRCWLFRPEYSKPLDEPSWGDSDGGEDSDVDMDVDADGVLDGEDESDEYEDDDMEEDEIVVSIKAKKSGIITWKLLMQLVVCLATTRGTKIPSWVIERGYKDTGSWDPPELIQCLCSHFVAVTRKVEVEDN